MNLYSLLTREDIYYSLKKKFSKDEIIFQEDDRCSYVCIVRKGEVVISTYTLSGNEIIFNRITDGGIFGNNLLFSDTPNYRGHVIAKKDTDILMYSKEAFLRVLQHNKEFLNAYLVESSNFTKSLNGQIKLLSFTSAEERFLYFLKEKKTLKFKSVSALANTLFLSREALSRLISKLVKNGRISRKGNMIELLK